jgi:hypothetical protein
MGLGSLALLLAACGGGDYVDPNAPSGGSSPQVTDLADGTVTGGVTTLTSFRDGVTGWSVVDTSGAAADKLATITLDSKSALATDGQNAAKVVVADAKTNAYIAWTPSVGDWSGKRYLKVDMAATGGVFYVKLATKSGSGWTWCDIGGDGPTKADANAATSSAATVTFDLSALTCYGGSFTANDVKQLMLWVDGTGGTYTIDNLRLEDGTTTPVATDVADGTLVNGALVLYSFKSDVSALSPFDSNGNAAPAFATITLDANSAWATEGVNAAKVVVPVATDKGYVGGTPAVTDWSAYRYFKVDMLATGGIWYAKLATKSGSGWVWCDQGGDGPTKTDAAGLLGKTSMATLSFDLNALTCYGGSLDKVHMQQFMLWVEGDGGTYYIDNIRLSN